MASTTLVLSCEHGGNKIPAAYRPLAKPGLAKALASHRGYDWGALPLGQQLAKELAVPFFPASVSRLLVDLNRSAHHRGLISEFFKDSLSSADKQALLARYYTPHRSEVTATIAALLAKGQAVLHLAVHSFTPVLGGERRQAECGLLYDPTRQGERQFCARWQNELALAFPRWRIRKNYPYQGKTDGFTTALRREFAGASYYGVELEINNKLLRAPGEARQMGQLMAPTLRACLARSYAGEVSKRG